MKFYDVTSWSYVNLDDPISRLNSVHFLLNIHTNTPYFTYVIVTTVDLPCIYNNRNAGFKE